MEVNQFIILDHDLGTLYLSVNTEEQIERAKKIMRDHGACECVVWLGEPDDGNSEAVKSSMKLFA